MSVRLVDNKKIYIKQSCFCTVFTMSGKRGLLRVGEFFHIFQQQLIKEVLSRRADTS